MRTTTKLLATLGTAAVSASLAIPAQAAAGTAGAGELDQTFGNGGIVTTAFPGTDMSTGGNSVLQADGKTVVAGERWNGPLFTPAFVRYNEDGSLDTSFGFGGTAVASLGKTQSASVSGIFQTSDGGYLAVATNKVGVRDDALNRVVTIRFTKDGKLDQTYGQAGIAVAKPSLPAGSSVMAADAVSAGQGKFAVAVSLIRGDTQTQQTGVLKLTKSGTVDKTFGQDGLATTPANRPFGVKAIAVDSKGDIALAGGVSRSQDPEDEASAAAVARLTARGTVDTDFGAGGIATVASGVSNFANSVSIDSHDRIVTAGYAQSEGEGRAAFEVTRHTPSGTLDAGFANKGVGIYQVTDNEDVANSVAIDRQGRILVGGTMWKDNPELVTANSTATQAPIRPGTGKNATERQGVSVLRLANDGTADKSFGNDGHTLTQPEYGSQAQWIGQTADGKVQMSGFSFSADLQYKFLSTRYNG